MTTIDPDAHQDLIDLQRAERLRLRTAAAEASAVKDAAVHASGLVQEHGYHQVNVDLRNAARTAGT